MKSEFSADDIRYLADITSAKFLEKGYMVQCYVNTVIGKYGCVYNFSNGLTYTTGLDSKDICAKKMINIINNIDEMVVKYCAVNNL